MFVLCTCVCVCMCVCGCKSGGRRLHVSDEHVSGHASPSHPSIHPCSQNKLTQKTAKKEAEQKEETAAINDPAATGAGEHLSLSTNPLEGVDAKQGGKEEEMELSAAGGGGKTKGASRTSAGDL